MFNRPSDSKLARPASPTRPPTSIKSPNLPVSSRTLVLKRLYIRRTLIPIMLTLGILFFAIGAAQWLADDDFPFSAKNMLWSAIALPMLGAMLVGMALINVNYVRHQLAAAK